MTASDPGRAGGRPLAGSADSRPLAGSADSRPLADRALDLLVYAPAGLLITAAEDFPEVAAKGRARVAQEVRNARVVGRFAVDFGWRQISQQLESLAAAGRQGDEAPAAPRHPATPGAGKARPAPDPAVDRAIPGYDTLSASQVARRLDGLSPEDLRAVVRHEAAGRRRRTVLTRAEQLLGPAAPPSTS